MHSEDDVQEDVIELSSHAGAMSVNQQNTSSKKRGTIRSLGSLGDDTISSNYDEMPSGATKAALRTPVSTPRSNRSSSTAGDSTYTTSSGKVYTSTSERILDTLHIHEEVINQVTNAFHAPSAKYVYDAKEKKIFRQAGHLEENWLGEFMDLILVASLIKLGDGLHYCGLHFEEILFVALEFFTLFQTRYMIDEFMWHFFIDDLINQVLFFVFIAGVFIMALMTSYSIDEVTYECQLQSFHLSTFFIGLLVTRLVLSLFWILELWFDGEARDLYYMYPIRNFITIALCLTGIILNYEVESIEFQRFYSYYLIIAVIFNEYYLHFYKAFHKKPLIDLNEYWPFSTMQIKTHDHDTEILFECDEELHTVQTRMGVFILIVLGEAMIQLLIPSFDLEHKNGMVWLTLMGLLLVWSVAKQFFDAAQRVPKDHALRRCMRSGYQWIIMHSVSGWFVFIMGIGLKFLYSDLRYELEPNKEHLYMLSVGCTGTVFCFTFMRFLHKGWGTWPENQPRLAAYSLRFLFAGIHMSICWWGLSTSEEIVTWHTIVSFLLNSLDFVNFKSSHYIDEESEEHDEYHDGYDSNDDDIDSSVHSASDSTDVPFGAIGVNGIRTNTYNGETPVVIPKDYKNTSQKEDKEMEKNNDDDHSANSTPTIQVKKRLSSTSNFASMISNMVALSTKDTKDEEINQTERKGSSTNIFGMDLFQNRRNRAGQAGKRTPRPHSAGQHGDGSRTPGTPTSGTPTNNNVKGSMTPTKQGMNIGRKARNDKTVMNRNLSDTNLIRTSETMQVYGSETNLNSHSNSIDTNDDSVVKRPASSADILQDAHHHRNVSQAIAALEAENDVDSEDEEIVIPNRGGTRRNGKN